VTYLALTDADREAMLEEIGVSSIEELFADLPESVRLGRELNVRPAMTEQELTSYFEELASQNAHVGAELSFLGAGMYDHYSSAASS
jgi:glycine dehydrogenase subunit 1